MCIPINNAFKFGKLFYLCSTLINENTLYDNKKMDFILKFWLLDNYFKPSIKASIKYIIEYL